MMPASKDWRQEYSMAMRSARRAHRTHTPAFKAQVTLAAWTENKTLAELAKQFEVHANQITEWRRQLLEYAAGAVGGTAAASPQPGSSQPAPGHKMYPYLLRHLPITRSNQVSALDRIYIPMAHGFVYLTAVDVFSRMALAHKVTITPGACHAKEIIEKAMARHSVPEIVNTDQGSQFTAIEFTDAILGFGCKLPMDGKGAWRDNVFVERLWRSVSTNAFT
jgi:transposase InsO family protein